MKTALRGTAGGRRGPERGAGGTAGEEARPSRGSRQPLTAPPGTSPPGGVPAALLILAILYPVAVVLSSPYIGTVRDFLQDRLAEGFVPLMKALVATAAVLVGWSIVRVLARAADPWRRAAWLVVLAGFVVLQLQLTSTPEATVNWVERTHIFEYSLMSVLFWSVLRRGLGGLGASVNALLLTAMVGTIDETVQWIVPSRVGDIRDVELNVASGLLGQFFVLLVLRPDGMRWRLRPREARLILVLLAATVALGSGFFMAVHAGRRIVDPAIGEFRSGYSEKRLRELVARYADPEVRARSVASIRSGRQFRIQDFYLSEGIAHIAARNRQKYEKREAWAFKEQLIVETYYPAALDLKRDPTRSSSFNPEASKRAGAGRTYRSPQYSDILYTGPKWAPLLSAGAVSVALLALAFRKRRRFPSS